jgi:signal transduction histidine kinase
VEIADAGKGLSSTIMGGGSGNARLGVGILGMKERVSRLGGTFEISSNGSGTAVRAKIPIDPPPAAKTA